MKGLGLSTGENQWKPLDLLEKEQTLMEEEERREAAGKKKYDLKYCV